jgi:protein SCO1/2
MGEWMTRLWALLAGTVLLSVLGATAWVALRPDQDRFASCREGGVAGGAGAIGGPFTLVDQDGRTVSDAQVIDGPTLLYFGFASCPDVCPLDNARNAEAVDILEERGIGVTPVFISVDPARDTPEVLRDYVQNLHPDMIGLTGTEEQVRAAAQAYRVYYKAQPAEDGFYLVDHSTFTYLVLPDYGFVDYFRRETSADEIAERVACVVDAL